MIQTLLPRKENRRASKEKNFRSEKPTMLRRSRGSWRQREEKKGGERKTALTSKRGKKNGRGKKPQCEKKAQPGRFEEKGPYVWKKNSVRQGKNVMRARKKRGHAEKAKLLTLIFKKTG